MTIEAEITRVIGLFQLPFMQRALMGGVLTGLMGRSEERRVGKSVDLGGSRIIKKKK